MSQLSHRAPDPEEWSAGGQGGAGAPGPHPDRPHYRPPVGLPLEKQSPWAVPISVLIHALIILLILSPILLTQVIPELTQGAGGPGPAGGGGGGRNGSGGGQHVVERIQYVAPAAPPPAPEPQPTITPPVVPPVTPPVQKKEEPTPTTPNLDLKLDVPKSSIDMALTAGIGGGTGRDGSNGTGPGSGGGVGSGVGTGRGSATGPGTGGGPGTIFPPAPDFTPLPPMPVPNKVKGQVVRMVFTVSERGETLKIDLAPGSSDSGYNRKIIEQFREARFRPATKWDGTPVAATIEMRLSL